MSVQFNTSPDNISWSGPTYRIGTEPYWMSCWFKSTGPATTGNSVIASVANPSSDSRYHVMQQQNNDDRLRGVNRAEVIRSAYSLIDIPNDGGWHHCAHLISSSGFSNRVYLDGVAGTDGDGTNGTFGGMTVACAGAILDSSPSYTGHPGIVADVAIWNDSAADAQTFVNWLVAGGYPLDAEITPILYAPLYGPGDLATPNDLSANAVAGVTAGSPTILGSDHPPVNYPTAAVEYKPKLQVINRGVYKMGGRIRG